MELLRGTYSRRVDGRTDRGRRRARSGIGWRRAYGTGCRRVRPLRHAQTHGHLLYCTPAALLLLLQARPVGRSVGGFAVSFHDRLSVCLSVCGHDCWHAAGGLVGHSASAAAAAD